MPSPEPQKPLEPERDLDRIAFLERAEEIYYKSLVANGRRVFSTLVLGLIRSHEPENSPGEVARLQRTMTAVFGEDPVIGRPAKDHERALLRMIDMHVADKANRFQWESNKKLGAPTRGPKPRVRGAEPLASAAAVEIYGDDADEKDSLVRRLKDDFNRRRDELVELRARLIVDRGYENDLANFIISLLADVGLDAVCQADSLIFNDIEELVY